VSGLLMIYPCAGAAAGILRRHPPGSIPLPPEMQDMLESVFGVGIGPAEAVRRVVGEVREEGDQALRRWGAVLDGVEPCLLEAGPADFAEAVDRLPEELVRAMRISAERIRSFHYATVPRSLLLPGANGILGSIARPVGRAGIYVPGGSAPLFSTLLMSAIPASCAGVGEIIACTPPGRDGRFPDAILAAASLSGVSRLFCCGGAQAIAAMAFGTRTIPRVDKIAGPGNIFVMLAKREVYGAAGIDGLQGPSELMIVADASADPSLLAADLVAQAEHDPMAAAILVTPDRSLAEETSAEVDRAVPALPRSRTISSSLASRGGAIVVGDLMEAFDIAARYAPEHLELCIADPWSAVGSLGPAGAVFLGSGSCEILGDYVAGPSHSLPTSGSARFSSGLGVQDFMTVTSLIALERDPSLLSAAALMASAEGLDGHAAASRARLAP
jgi:histidinol dehydrogenase